MEIIFIPSVFLISFAFCSVCALTCIIHPNKWITWWNFLFHLSSLRWCLLDINDICIIIHSLNRQTKTFWKVQCAHIYWIDHCQWKQNIVRTSIPIKCFLFESGKHSICCKIFCYCSKVSTSKDMPCESFFFRICILQ